MPPTPSTSVNPRWDPRVKEIDRFVRAMFEQQKEPPRFRLAVSPKTFQPMASSIMSPPATKKPKIDKAMVKNGEVDDDDDKRDSLQFVPQQLLFPVLNQPTILEYLAPLDILSLWRSSKGTWNNAMQNIPATKRWDCIKFSLFRYLYISQEAAERVKKEMLGGWNLQGAFLFRLLGLCQHLVHIYGPYEPDPAHRAYLAESCCFYHHPDEDCGALINYSSTNMGEEEEQQQQLPVPTLEQLKTRTKIDDEPDGESATDDCCVLWGDAGEGIIGEGGDRRHAQWWQSNQAWMRQNAESAPNPNYQRRIEKGCDPIIWLQYNCMSEVEQVGLGVGAHHEQLLLRNCFGNMDLHLEDPKQFLFCDTKNTLELYNGGHRLKGGVPDFLICYARVADGEDAHLGVLIWCFRRGFVPCSKEDLERLIDDDNFLLEALESEKFGPVKVGP